MKKMFCQNIFLIGYVPLGLKKAVLTTTPKMIQRKNQKMFPGRPKKIKSEKVKFLSKLFFQLPIWRQIVKILQQCCKSSAANRTFCRPKSQIVSQSQHNVFFKVFLWTRKKLFWRFRWKISTKTRKIFAQIPNYIAKKGFWKNKSSKLSRTFRMKYWQNWQNFFFRTKISFARTRS